MVSGRARNLVMSAETREHLENFWELIDDILNVVLFLPLGLQLWCCRSRADICLPD